MTDDIDCDICIVGAGYTGLWTAYFLKSADPGLNVHLLEASYAGAGASGHNDGFVTGVIGGQSWLGLARRYGPEHATAAHTAVARSVIAIHRFSCSEHLAIEIEPLGYYSVATSRRQDRQLADSHALAARINPSGKYPPLLGRAAMQARIQSPVISSGIWRAGMLINPHKLARGLARVVEKAGTAIHERTPVTDVRDDGRRILLETPSATVRATRAVLATNAWQRQFPPFRRKVTAWWHYALVTAPLTAADLDGLNWRGREGFIEVHRPGIFGRLTADNRILFGGGRAWDGGDADPGCVSAGKQAGQAELLLRRAFARYFPMLGDIPVTHFYGGAMGVTPDRMPSLGQLSPRLAYAYGYSGNGISVSHTAGQLMRDLLLGKDSPAWTRILFRADERRLLPERIRLLAWKSQPLLTRRMTSA